MCKYVVEFLHRSSVVRLRAGEHLPVVFVDACGGYRQYHVEDERLIRGRSRRIVSVILVEALLDSKYDRR
jgi:hypothetical protein